MADNNHKGNCYDSDDSSEDEDEIMVPESYNEPEYNLNEGQYRSSSSN